MEVGEATESVVVTAQSPALDTDQQRVRELPVFAGNPLELILLTPGITEPSRFMWKSAWNFRQITSDGMVR